MCALPQVHHPGQKSRQKLSTSTPIALRWICVCFLYRGRNPGPCVNRASILPLRLRLGPPFAFLPWDRGLTHLFKPALTLRSKNQAVLAFVSFLPRAPEEQDHRPVPAVSVVFFPNSCWARPPLNQLCLRYNPTTTPRNRILIISYIEKEMARSDQRLSGNLRAQAGPHCRSL